jgi:hypothetical protein
MALEERTLEDLARSIAIRIRSVCEEMSEADFLGLCLQMARVQRRGEQRSGTTYHPGPRRPATLLAKDFLALPV